MATTVDELIVQIRADTADLRRGLNGVKNQLGTLDKSTNQSILTFKRLAGVFAAIGIVQLGRNVINTSRTFQDLNATLRAITGSSEGAAASMELITAFTANTTFQLENVTSAFTTLLNAGITPTTDVLSDFGNVAAAFGKDITQISQAAFNATTGEMEMLKQFGIIAKVEGDKLAVTFDNTTTTIERNSQSIIDFIRKIGSEKFPTALEERADTVSGSFSNLADATSILFNAVGESGLNEALTSLARGLIDIVNTLTPVAGALGQAINDTFKAIASGLDAIQRNAYVAVTALSILFGQAMYNNMAAVSGAIKALVLNFRFMALELIKIARRNPVLLFGGLAVAVAALSGEMGTLNDAIKEQVESFDSLMESNFLVGGLYKQLKDSLAIFDAFFTVGGPNADFEELDANLEALVGTTAGTAGQIKDNAQLVKEEIESMNESIISSTQQMTQTFVSGLMEGQNALEGFKTFTKNLVSQIISTFLNMMVVNNILNAIFGRFGMAALPTISLGGGGTGSGAAGPIVRSAIPAPTFVGPSPLGNAGGGNISRGQPYLVGERGPELFMPNTGGRVMNNADTRNAGTGGDVVVNQTINLSAGVVGTVRSEVQRMLPEIANVAKVGVLEATRRGGTYRRGLLGS